MAAADYMKSGNIVFYLSLGLSDYEYKAEDESAYAFGIIPWLSRDGSNNTLTRNVSSILGSISTWRNRAMSNSCGTPSMWWSSFPARRGRKRS